jgi:hypothetical protein
MLDRTIRLGDATDFVELHCVEFGKPPGMSDGDLRLSVSVSYERFSGSYDEIWIARDDWSQFVASLVRLEREREGVASLFSLSPDEFELHLRIVGHRGGAANVDGFLSRYNFCLPSGTQQSCVYYSFYVDPSMLREIVGQFIDFGQPVV